MSGCFLIPPWSLNVKQISKSLQFHKIQWPGHTFLIHINLSLRTLGTVQPVFSTEMNPESQNFVFFIMENTFLVPTCVQGGGF